MQKPELLSTERAGIYLGGEENPIPAATLRWWRAMSRGPRYLKLGRAVRYRRTDLDAFRDEGVREAASHG